MEQGGEIEIENRNSTNENNDERYTQVENDVLSNPIEGYKEDKEENEENVAEIKEKDDSTIKQNKKEFKKLKIILLGEFGSGKTSLINRYINNKFNNFGQATIGSDVKSKKFEVDKNLTAELLIHDTTNEEKLGKITRNYYLDAHGAIIVFDLTNEQSFLKLKYWMDELNSNAPKDIVLCILGNKADLDVDRKVKFEDAKNLAGDHLYYEVSAKTGNNVSLAFEQLTIGVIEKQKEEESNPDKVLRGKEGRKTTDLNDLNKDLMSKKKCC